MMVDTTVFAVKTIKAKNLLTKCFSNEDPTVFMLDIQMEQGIFLHADRDKVKWGERKDKNFNSQMATIPTLILTVNTFNVVSTEFGVVGTADIMGNNPKGMITFNIFLGSGCFPGEPIVFSTSVAVMGNKKYSSPTIFLRGRDVDYSMTATFKSSDTSNTDATSNCAEVSHHFQAQEIPAIE